MDTDELEFATGRFQATARGLKAAGLPAGTISAGAALAIICILSSESPQIRSDIRDKLNAIFDEDIEMNVQFYEGH